MPALLTRTCSAPLSLDDGVDRRAGGVAVGDVQDDAAAAGVRRQRFADRRARRPRWSPCRRRVSPWPASASAIARPMPRDAPVTSATWPAIWQARSCAATPPLRPATPGRRPQPRPRRRSMRLTMPASTLPGPHSTMWVTPRARMRLDRLDPAHRRRTPGGTAHRGSPPARSRTATSMLLTTGMTGASNGVSSPAVRAGARRPASSGSNGTAPTPAAAARAWRPSPSAARRPCSTPAFVPAITVCFGSLKLTASTTSPLAAAASAQPSTTACGVEAEDRRHRAGADRHRLLHRLGAKAHQRQRIGQAQRAGGDQRGVLAERVARRRRRAPRRLSASQAR